MSSISLARPPRRRKLLAGVAAVAACAGLSAAAQDAQAAFTLAACGGSNAAKNQGGSFQNGAQTYWRNVFSSSNGCAGAVALQSFNSNGSGNGLAAMGAGGGSTGSPFINCSPSCGTANSGGGRTLAAGERDATTAFSSTDEPPTPTQQTAMNTGTASTTDDALVHVIPVATGAAAVVVHPPNGCDLSTITNHTDGLDPDGAGPLTAPDSSGDLASNKTQRPQITSAKLEAAFAGATTADTWGELTPGISGTPTAGGQNDGLACTDVPVKRIVRQDNSGTTYGFKAYLNLINPDRGWLTTYNPAPNTVWPAAGGSGLASPVKTAASPDNICGNTTAGSPPVANPDLLCSAPGSGGGGLAGVVSATQGSIGYVDLATARSNGFEVTPDATTQDYTFWIPLQNNPAGTATKYVEPTIDPVAHKPGIGARGASCGDAPVQNAPTPANSPKGDPTLGDWSKAFAAGGPGYPNCVLTYTLAWDDSAAAYGNTADEQGKARTVKDFLTTAVVSSAGQQFANVDYSPLPNPQAQPLLKYAQDGVAAIDWNKTAVVAQPVTPVTPVTPTPPVTPNPPVTPIPPAIVSPSNAFTVGTGKASSTRSSLAFTVKLPGAGKLVAAATYKSGSKTTKIATVNATAKSAGSAKVTVKLSSAARKVLAKKKKLSIKVKFTFTPTGGTAKTTTKSVTLRAAPVKKKK